MRNLTVFFRSAMYSAARTLVLFLGIRCKLLLKCIIVVQSRKETYADSFWVSCWLVFTLFCSYKIRHDSNPLFSFSFCVFVFLFFSSLLLPVGGGQCRIASKMITTYNSTVYSAVCQFRTKALLNKDSSCLCMRKNVYF